MVDAPFNPDAHSPESHMLRNVGIGVALLTGAVIAAPYVLPLLGLSVEVPAEILANLAHPVGVGDGLAGVFNSGLNAVPFIGKTLAANGIANVVAVGITGIGGVLLGRFIERRHDGDGINWGKVIRYGALATSLLIAMPSILTGVSMGLAYIASAVGSVAWASDALAFCVKIIGSAGEMSSIPGLSGTFAALPHLVTCGLSMVPASLAWLFSNKMDSNDEHDRMVAQLQAPEAPHAGKPCRAELTLLHGGKLVTPEQLAITHTEKLHVFVVDETMQDYHHLHPRPSSKPGVYNISFTPRTNHRYHVWAEAVTAVDGRPHRMHVDIPSARSLSVPVSITPANNVSQGELNCEWRARAALQGGKPGEVEIRLTDKNGKPVRDLQPLMGETAHLVGFSEDGKSMAHCHPVGNQQDGMLRFHVEPLHAGKAQFFLHIKRSGQEAYIPFGQHIKPPERKVEQFYHAALQPALQQR